MRRTQAAFLAVILAAGAAPAISRPLVQLQVDDAEVQSIGWKLARGNAAWCARVQPEIGLQLQDIANYDDPAKARGVLGFAGDIAVEAVAAGSPAEAAGLEANDAVLSIDGERMDALPPPAKAGDWRRLQDLHDRLDKLLARDGKVTLVVRHDGAERTVTVRGEPACAVRFELDTGRGGARATPRRVILGRKLYNELDGKEALVAAAMAHEFAHAVLDHQALLDKAGRSMRHVRHTEEEADRLSVWLLANAGYDPAAAERFMRTWGPKHDLSIFGMPDHDRWRTRAKTIRKEIEALNAARASDPQHAANWPRDFVRQKI